jgi:ribosomal protein S18 acetylase RimI-like enzyme
MPEIQVRPAIAEDIPQLTTLDHHYNSDYVWQMDFTHDRETGQMQVNFRNVRLPRSIRVDYPRSLDILSEDWAQRSGMLVALLNGKAIGYISLANDRLPLTTWITDLVIDKYLRRQGIGSALLLAAQQWAIELNKDQLILEMQPKNHPAIQWALKLGFEFCGYNDRYYIKHGTGIFFGKSL